MSAMSVELVDLRAKLAKARQALLHCEAWFRDYERSHTQKGDDEKARRNRHRADFAAIAIKETSE